MAVAADRGDVLCFLNPRHPEFQVARVIPRQKDYQNASPNGCGHDFLPVCSARIDSAARVNDAVRSLPKTGDYLVAISGGTGTVTLPVSAYSVQSLNVT
jgi:hypothetical protein